MKPGLKFCPRCKSTKIKKDISITTFIGIPPKWVCRNCNFKGHIFPEAYEE